jgi:hypothetical protein
MRRDGLRPHYPATSAQGGYNENVLQMELPHLGQRAGRIAVWGTTGTGLHTAEADRDAARRSCAGAGTTYE